MTSSHHHRHHHHHHHRHRTASKELHFWQHEFEAEFQEPLPPVWRATLFSEEPDGDGKPNVDPVCGLVLSSFGEKHWNGRCRSAKAEQNQLFDILNKDHDLKLDLQEARESIKRLSEDVRHHLPAALQGLLIDALVTAAFQSENFDLDGSGDLDKDEWNAFLDELEKRYLKYRRLLSFQSERAFYGRGWTAHLEEESDDETSSEGSTESSSAASDEDPAKAEVELLHKIALRAPEEDPPKMQWGFDVDGGDVGFVPPGWWEDFYYYSANHHPIHGIFCCDPDHQLSSTERVFMEIATLGFLFIAADLKAKLRREDEGGNLDESDLMKHSLNALISLAGIFVYYVQYLLFTCPGLGYVDSSRATQAQVKRAAMCEQIGSAIGYVLMAFLGVTLVVEFPVLQNRWQSVLGGRLQAYVFTWVLYLLTPFNPFVAWGNNSTNPADFDKFHIGDYLGVGQWRIEKQRFMGQCRKLKGVTLEEMHTKSVQSVSNVTTASKPPDLFAGFRTMQRLIPAGRNMEVKRGPKRARAERSARGGRKQRPRQSSSLGLKPRGSRSSLSLARWGEVFSNADLAWRQYMSGRCLRDLKPDSATA